ncbi:peptidase S8/S53 domain-containing protein [Cladochytrium replicatum]|nr:peptidase S8/S53 domain-containing protein [Cladochytrium replicatum]
MRMFSIGASSPNSRVAIVAQLRGVLDTDADIQVRQTFDSPTIKGFSFSIISKNAKINAKDVLNHLKLSRDIASAWPVRLVPKPKLIQHGSGLGASPNLVTAHTLTGVANVQNLLGLTGKGIKIGVVDTGVYWKHPALGAGFGPGHKIGFGYDIVGDDYGPFNPVAVPDADPEDACTSSTHGTHVMGIVGANATGDFSRPEWVGDLKPVAPFTGVAPGANLGMFRVFGCDDRGAGEDVVVAGVLKAIEMGSDLVSLSLGLGPGFPEQSFIYMSAQALAQQGHIILFANGNDGDAGLFTASGMLSDTIGVASFDNSEFNTRTVFSDLGDRFPFIPTDTTFYAENWAYRVGIVVNDPNAKVGANSFDGCFGIKPKDVKGKYVLFLDDGDIACPINNHFVNERSYASCYDAYEAGAAGCMFYGPDEALRSTRGMGFLPGISVRNSDGERMKQILAKDPQAKFNITKAVNPFKTLHGGKISSFSSKGFAANLLLKPQFGGIGGDVYSTIGISANWNENFKDASYASYSGTSMSTPYVAGAVGLLLESMNRTGLSKIEVRDIVRNRLSNYAKPAQADDKPGQLLSVAMQGAGLIDMYETVIGKGIVTPSSISLNDTAHFVNGGVFTLTIKNDRNREAKYFMHHAPALSVYPSRKRGSYLDVHPAILSTTDFSELEFTPQKLHLEAGETGTVTVKITPPAGLDASRSPIYSGYIRITNCADNTTIHVPYVGMKGNFGDMSVFVTDPKQDNTGILPPGSFDVGRGVLFGGIKASTKDGDVFDPDLDLPVCRLPIVNSVRKLEIIAYDVVAQKELGPAWILFQTANAAEFGQNIVNFPRMAETNFQGVGEPTYFFWAGQYGRYDNATNSLVVKRGPATGMKLRYKGLKNFATKGDDWDVVDSVMVKFVYDNRPPEEP